MYSRVLVIVYESPCIVLSFVFFPSVYFSVCFVVLLICLFLPCVICIFHFSSFFVSFLMFFLVWVSRLSFTFLLSLFVYVIGLYSCVVIVGCL